MMYRSTTATLFVALLAGSFFLFGCDSVGSEGGTDEENEAPSAVINISPGDAVDVGEQVTLDASGSADSDGDQIEFSWTFTPPSGSNASLSDSSAEQATFTPDEEGEYTVELTVSDGEEEDTDSGTVTATVQASVVEINANVTSDRILSPESSYLVTSDICVQNGATLTIEPGVQLEFEANTSLQICDDNAALIAAGTSESPISMTGTQSDPEGWWQGVASYSIHPNNELSYVRVEDAGSQEWSRMDRAASVAINTGNQLTLTNSTIENGGGFGIHVDESEGDLTFSTNTFSGNQLGPVNVPFTVIGEIDAASSFEEGTYVRVWGANPSTGDVTVDALDVPYRIAGTPTLEGNVTVTISPGVEMEFTAHSNLTIGNSDAALVAIGEAENEIVMVGTQSDPEGWWQGIASYSTSPNNELTYVRIEDAGSQEWSRMDRAASVAINTGNQLTLTNSTIQNGGGFGLHLDEDDGNLTFSTNTFSSNQLGPINVPFTVIGEIDAGSSFQTGTVVRVWDANPSTGDITVDALNVPYRIAGTPTIQGDATVSISPGVEMEFTANSNLTVGSNDAALLVTGEPGQRITMTAAAGNESSGYWQGIGFYSSNPYNQIRHTLLEYAGSSEWSRMDEAASIGLNTTSQLTLTDSEITDSGSHGVHCDEPNDASFSGSNNTFENITGNDVNGCN